MTEQEWLECMEPAQMGIFMRGKISPRKKIMILCAFLRFVWPYLNDEDLQIVLAAEEADDGSQGSSLMVNCGLYLELVAQHHGAVGCALIRDIVGNPFHSAQVGPALRIPSVLSLAQSAYDQRPLPEGQFNLELLAVLADALEDAGCTDPDILTHLRGPGPMFADAGHWIYCSTNRDRTNLANLSLLVVPHSLTIALRGTP